MSLLLCLALLLQFGRCQGIPEFHVSPPPEPIVVGCMERTVAICVVRANESAAITWRTGDQPYTVVEYNVTHGDGTVTSGSKLRMIPERKIHGLTVTCVIQQLQTPDIQIERTLTIQNIHFAPEMVDIDVLKNADESNQFSCHSNANPPAEYTWKRGDQVIASGKSTVILPREPEPGLYKCEAKNYLGANTGNLQIVEIEKKQKQSQSKMEDSLTWTIILGVIALFFSRNFSLHF